MALALALALSPEKDRHGQDGHLGGVQIFWARAGRVVFWKMMMLRNKFYTRFLYATSIGLM